MGQTWCVKAFIPGKPRTVRSHSDGLDEAEATRVANEMRARLGMRWVVWAEPFEPELDGIWSEADPECSRRWRRNAPVPA